MPIKVETNIPYGNACDVSVQEEKGITVVSLAADPHGGPETLWFCFRLRQTRQARRGGKVKLVLKHLLNMLGCGNAPNLRPVIRRDGEDWERMGPGKLEEFPDGRAQAVWVMDAPRKQADIAVCYPYGRQELDALAEETDGYWQADVIGISQGGRPLVRVSNGPGLRGSDRPGLYLVARQHSGETPGTWLLDGMLRYFASAGKAAPLVWAVPLTNIDGIEQGDYGKDNFPYDLNRAWGSPAMRHEVLVFQRDMHRWADRCRPALGLDLHAPGGSEGDGIYAHICRGTTEGARIKTAGEWARLLGEAMGREYACENFGRTTEWGERWLTPCFSTFCWNVLAIPALCVEVPYAVCGKTLMTREHYREAGRRAAAGIIKRLKK